MEIIRNDYEETDDRTDALASLFLGGTTVKQRIASSGTDRLWETPYEGHWCAKNEDGGYQTQIGEDHRVVIYADKFHGISLPF